MTDVNGFTFENRAIEEVAKLLDLSIRSVVQCMEGRYNAFYIGDRSLSSDINLLVKELVIEKTSRAILEQQLADRGDAS